MTARRAGRRHRRGPGRRPLAGAVLVLVMLVVLLPVLLVVATSLRSGAEITARPLGLPLPPHWGNYPVAAGRMSYPRGLANTLLVTAATTALTVFTGSLCGYGLARHVRRWTVVTYRCFVAGLTVPVFVFLTPLFLFMRDLGLLDSYQSVILGYTALHLPLAVFFYTGALRAVPPQLEEAAVLDGCSPAQAFRRVVLPVLRPATATLSVLIALAVWNDLVMPLLFLTDERKQTVALSVYALVGSHGYRPAELFPAVVLATLPLLVLLLVLQRRVVVGITSGVSRS